MAKNIKITPAVGKLEFIGNTLVPAASTTSFIVDAGGNITLTPASTSNAYIVGLGIDPAVLLGTANQIALGYGGANGHVTLSLPNTVIFPGVARVASAPVDPTDLANRAYVDANSNKRLVVRATSAVNVSVSSASATVDGLTLANGDRVLLTGQTSQVENGIYVFNGTGVALTRATDFNTWAQIVGALVTVQQGSSFGGSLWMSTVSNGGTVGSTAITFKRVDNGAGSNVPANAGVVHTDGFVFTASKIVDADVNDVAWNKITGVPSTITTQTLQTVTQNGNSTNQNINLLSTGVPATPSSGVTLFADTNAYFGWRATDSFFRRFSSTNTADRDYTLPDSSGTIVLTQGVQTIDNKVLTNTTINVASDAQGDLYYRGATGKLVNLPLGASNRILAAGVGQPFWTNSIPWSFITGSPTTLAGYGITDPILLRTGGTMTGNLFLNTDPTAPLQAATKNYVDFLAQGLAWKNPARASTGGVALPTYTVDGTFTILTATTNGALPAQDGITLIVGDELLVMDETSGNAPNNGSYLVTQIGNGSTPWILTRTQDANTGTELVAATYYIQQGTNRGNRVYTQNTPSPITLGTSSISFVQIAGTSTYTNGAGLSLTGNVFSITNLGVTNAMLTNSSINLAITSAAGTVPTWTNPSVALGGTATLNLTYASATQNGILSFTDWQLFNSKAPGNNAYVQSGNSFGAVGALGTLDGYDMSFIAGGVESMRINNVTRNVLIGKTSDDGANKLQVLGTSIIVGSANAPTTIIRSASSQLNSTPLIKLENFDGSVQYSSVYADLSNLLFTIHSATAITGTNNTAFGKSALNFVIDGSNNSAFGFQALQGISSGTDNVSVGSNAASLAGSASFNIALGSNSLFNLNSGVSNIAIGYQALSTIFSGNNNVAIGHQAGFSVTGSGNVFIGYQAANSQTSISNRLYIANSSTTTPLIYGEFDNALVTINGVARVAATALTGSASTTALLITQSWNTTGNPVLIDSNVIGTAFGASSLLMRLSVSSVIKFSINPQGNIFAAGNATINGAIFLLTSTSAGVGTIYKNGLPYISSYNGSGTQDRSIFVGYNSGNLSNTSIGFNAALGYQTLKALTSGSENTAIGSNALTLLTSGNNNVAIGSLALQKLTTANNNIAIGENALGNNIIGSSNVAIGHQAGLNNPGSGNVFIGFNAGLNEVGSNTLYISNSSSNFPLIKGDFANSIATINGKLVVASIFDVESILITAAINKSSSTPFIKFADFGGNPYFSINGNDVNVFIGNAAGASNWTGSYNVGIGLNSLMVLTNGNDNVAIGRNTLKAATTSLGSTVVGSNAGASITSATANTALGLATLQLLTTGSNNTAIGSQAMNAGNGDNNTMLGYRAGASITGSGNIMIGAGVADFSSGNNLSNRLYIDISNTTAPLIYGEFDNRKITLNALVTIASVSQTGSSANSALAITQTWNTSGTPNLISVALTDTASNAASRLIRMQVNAVDILTVTKAGNTFIKGNLTVDTMVAPVNAYQFVVWDTTTHTYGIVASAGSGSGFTSAINGLSSPSAGVVQLGQPTNAVAGIAQLTANTYIPLNNFQIQFVSTATTEYINLSKNTFTLHATSGTQIGLSTQGTATISMVDFDTNMPAILMSRNVAGGAVQIQNNNGVFQIVETTQTSGFVYDAINYRFGIKTLAPTFDFHVTGNVGIVHSLTGSAATSALSIAETWNTTGVPTAILVNITKTAVGAGSRLLDIKQDTLSRLVVYTDSGFAEFTANGLRLQNSSSGPGGISLNASGPTINAITVSQGFVLGQSNGITGAGVNIITVNPGGVLQTTSGTLNGFSVIPSGPFDPTSGTSVFNVMNLQFTINQTGGANGITRGLYINPTLTSAVNFRALEIAAGLTVIRGLSSPTQVLTGAQNITTTSMNWIFTGSSIATWTLPDVGVTPTGTMFFVKNRGSANLTINVAASGQIYDSSASSTLVIAPGDAYIFVNDGTYWNAE